jgi:predicted phage terminase large subunit-like protein
MTTKAKPQSDDTAQLEAQLLEQRRIAMRLLHAKKAKASLIDFTQFTMPDPEDPSDATKSRYDPQYFHRALAQALEDVEAGRMMRLIITFPPRHGKSELSSKRFPAWFVGRDPYRYCAVCTYNQTFAEDIGRTVRGIIRQPAYAQAFPGVTLRKGSTASDRLETEEGGALYFLGRGGTITGRGADLIIIDDPIKNSDEARSETVRNSLWEWFQSDIKSRFMTDTGAMIVIQCMTGDTPVLMADGSERFLRDVRPGDRIATYDNGSLTTSTIRNWANNGPDFVYEIRMTSGITVKANARHPFLVVRDGVETWVRLRDMAPGDQVRRAIATEAAIAREELGVASPALGMDATPRPSAKGFASHITISTVGQAATGRHHQPTAAQDATQSSSTDTASALPNTTPCTNSKAVSAPSANALPAAALPTIGVKPSALTTITQLDGSGDCSAMTATLSSGEAEMPPFCAEPWNTWRVMNDTVASILPCGREDVFDVQVDRTENFIANGLVSHNTRWHEDDLVGRLTDPSNPHYDAEEAATWKIINIPAIAEDNDVLGRKPGEPLWPERFGLDYLNNFKRTNPRGFSALYQQKPTPEDGDLIKKEMIKPYKPDQLPKNLRIYAASDHAVGIKQENDKTCLLVVGIDDVNRIWLLDCWWQRARTDKVVEAMIGLMKKWKPVTWWAESGHISKSIGPFLYKRMTEEKVYVHVQEQVPSKDKVTRAQSIIGRMAMGMVYLPLAEPWYEDAKQELLKFPNARHDDFVDTLAHIGMGLERQMRAPQSIEVKTGPKVGSLAWVKFASEQRKRRTSLATQRGW